MNTFARTQGMLAEVARSRFEEDRLLFCLFEAAAPSGFLGGSSMSLCQRSIFTASLSTPCTPPSRDTSIPGACLPFSGHTHIPVPTFCMSGGSTARRRLGRSFDTTQLAFQPDIHMPTSLMHKGWPRPKELMDTLLRRSGHTGGNET